MTKALENFPVPQKHLIPMARLAWFFTEIMCPLSERLSPENMRKLQVGYEDDQFYMLFDIPSADPEHDVVARHLRSVIGPALKWLTEYRD